MNRKVLWLTGTAVLLSVGVLASVALRTAVRNKAQMARRFHQPIPVKAAAAVAGEMSEVISAPVTLRPLTERVVNAQMTARVTEVLVKVGDVVQQGQVLARLDATSIVEDILQAETAVKKEQANLSLAAAPTRAELIQQAQIAVEQARQVMEHAKRHWEQQKDYARQRIKAAESNVTAVAAMPRPPQIEAARAAVESAQELLRQAEQMMDAAQSRVQETQAMIAQARTERDYWHKVLQTKKALYQQKLIARQEVDDAEKSYQTARAQLQEAQATFDRAQANLRAAQASRDFYASEVKRAQENLNVVLLGPKPEDVQKAQEELEQVKQQAQMDVDTARHAYEDAQQEYKKAREELRLRRSGPRPEEVRLARAQLGVAATHHQVAKAQLRKVVVRSPANGIVTARNIDPGEIVSPSGPPAASTIPGQPLPSGVKVGAGLFSIAEMIRVDAVAQVEETRVKQIHVGQRGDVTLDAFPTETFRGVVRLVESNVNPATRTFSVFIALSQAKPEFRPNMQGVARLHAPRRTLLVPSMALTISPQKPFESTVFVIKNGQARLRRVRIGATQEGKTEILSGLRRGERVAVYDLSQLRDGDRVAMNPAR